VTFVYGDSSGTGRLLSGNPREQTAPDGSLLMTSNRPVRARPAVDSLVARARASTAGYHTTTATAPSWSLVFLTCTPAARDDRQLLARPVRYDSPLRPSWTQELMASPKAHQLSPWAIPSCRHRLRRRAPVSR